MYSKSRKRTYSDGAIPPKEKRYRDGIRLWCAYWRANPTRMVADYFGYDGLHLFQKIILHMMFKSSTFFYLAARGQGKSYIIAWFMVIACTLYPNIKIIIASSTRKQSGLIVKEKILKELMKYPNVKREINVSKIKDGINEISVPFYNGSSIEVVVSSENSRGFRSQINIYEEFVNIDQDMIEKVLKRFKSTDRLARYRDNPKYKKYNSPTEPLRDLYISSASYESNWSWKAIKNSLKEMANGNDHGVIALPWAVSVYEGITKRKTVEEDLRSDEFTEATWKMEMEALYYSQNEKAQFKIQEIDKARCVTKVFRPIPNHVYLIEKDRKRWVKKYGISKKPSEVRLIGVDIAVMKGDNTVYTLCRLIPKGQEYIKQIVYIEHQNNAHAELQAIRLKQLYEDFDADVAVLDVMGVGMNLYDSCSKIIYDQERDKEYDAWKCINREDMKDRVFGVDAKDAMPCIFGCKADVKFNHQIAVYLKGDFENERIELPEQLKKVKEDYDESKELMPLSDYLKPFIETDLLQTELLNMENVNQASTMIKLENPHGRKDRFSSLSYMNYYAHYLQQDLLKEEQSYDEDDDVIDIYYTTSPIY